MSYLKVTTSGKLAGVSMRQVCKPQISGHRKETNTKKSRTVHELCQISRDRACTSERFCELAVDSFHGVHGWKKLALKTHEK